MASPPHAILIPYPAQGHVIPFLELAYCLSDAGFVITFVNTDFNHARVAAAARDLDVSSNITFVSVPDGMHDGDNRNDVVRQISVLPEVVPEYVEKLIRRSGETERRITCMVADENLAWLLPVAKKMGIRSAAFWPAAAFTLAALLSASKLVEDGVIHAEHGTPLKEGIIQLAPGMPAMDPSDLPWMTLFAGLKAQQALLSTLWVINAGLESADVIIANSSHELESPAFSYLSRVLPIGPLLPGRWPERPVGHFWPEDPTCLEWLDGRPAGSVVYVAFGSFTVFDPAQFQELALGLELAERPFLWVVRPDLVEKAGAVYPDGFWERVAGRGRIVGWSPQQKVLEHPAVACFVSHCGWNSTMEGVVNGVPFLCWPYFADQFLNRTYICDVWKNGLRLNPDPNGLIPKEEFEAKIQKLLGDGDIKKTALALKDLAAKTTSEGGSSCKNFNCFVEALKL